MFPRWISKIQPNSLILGPRRAGKTTLLKHLFPDYEYLTLDDFDYLKLAKNDPKKLMKETSHQLFIDEIQRAPELTITIKKEIDEKTKKFILTGSSAVKLLDQSSETLAGRINLLHLPTCCWGEEFGHPTHKIFEDEVPSLKIKEAQRNLNEALLMGGFPEVVCQKNSAEKLDILKKYRDTYFLRDLSQIANIDNVEALLSLMMYIARSIGSITEVSHYSREIGLSTPTIKKYLNILFQSDLTTKLYGYHFGPSKRYIKSGKIYFADNGIMQSLNLELNEGQILENFVISEFEKRRKLGFIPAEEFFYYKSTSGAEIDLIIETKNEILAIEIKSSINPSSKDCRNLINFNPQSNKICKRYLFYRGTNYEQIENVKLIPVAAIFRGQ
jgi:predicted AAA+ superfamily ATPase